MLLAAALAACGDGGDGAGPATTTATTGPPLDDAAFVAAAEAICASTRDVLGGLEAELAGETDRQRVAELLADRLVPALRDQADALDALTPPAAVAEELDAILAAIRARLGPIEADPVGRLLEAPEDPFGDLNARLRALGLEVCGGA